MQARPRRFFRSHHSGTPTPPVSEARNSTPSPLPQAAPAWQPREILRLPRQGLPTPPAAQTVAQMPPLSPCSPVRDAGRLAALTDAEIAALPAGHHLLRPCSVTCIIDRNDKVRQEEGNLFTALVCQFACDDITASVDDARRALLAAASAAAADLDLKPFYRRVSSHSRTTLGCEIVSSRPPQFRWAADAWSSGPGPGSPTPCWSLCSSRWPSSSRDYPRMSGASTRRVRSLHHPAGLRVSTTPQATSPTCPPASSPQWTAAPSNIPQFVSLLVVEDEVRAVHDDPILHKISDYLPAYLRKKQTLKYGVIIHLRSVMFFSPRSDGSSSSPASSDDDDSDGGDRAGRSRSGHGGRPRIHGFLYSRGTVDGCDVPLAASGAGGGLMASDLPPSCEAPGPSAGAPGTEQVEKLPSSGLVVDCLSQDCCPVFVPFPDTRKMDEDWDPMQFESTLSVVHGGRCHSPGLLVFGEGSPTALEAALEVRGTSVSLGHQELSPSARAGSLEHAGYPALTAAPDAVHAAGAICLTTALAHAVLNDDAGDTPSRIQCFIARVQVPTVKLLDTPATSCAAGAIQSDTVSALPLRSRRLAAHKLAGVPVAKREETG
ncbi:hypothetical protein BS78_08G122000 [Paspalum vaginatum]|nr:hypothetical protein BS78_08G122000 [Paspalum vaginatum]